MKNQINNSCSEYLDAAAETIVAFKTWLEKEDIVPSSNPELRFESYNDQPHLMVDMTMAILIKRREPTADISSMKNPTQGLTTVSTR